MISSGTLSMSMQINFLFLRKIHFKSNWFLSLTNIVALQSVDVITRFSKPAATGDAVAKHFNNKRTLSKNFAIITELVGV